MSVQGRSPTLEDEFDILVPSILQQTSPKHILIFFITGNPGLIEYYRNFLLYLAKSLEHHQHGVEKTRGAVQYHVHGASLAGFEVSSNSRRTQSSRSSHPPPFSLDEVKWDLIGRIQNKVSQIKKTCGLQDEKIPVILIGHSVGTWLLLESIAKYFEARQQTPQQQSSDPPVQLSGVMIAGGILLFPTVIELAKSPSGRRAGWILRPQSAPFILSVIARIILACIPMFVLAAIIQRLLHMEPHAGLVTATFLKSKHGVRQALHMARDELRQLDIDHWPDELWGVREASALASDAELATRRRDGSVPLYFLWGAEDHWIANTTRDSLISKRAQTADANDQGKPIMEVDSHGLSHAFSVRDDGAKMVASKAVEWILETERNLVS